MRRKMVISTTRRGHPAADLSLRSPRTAAHAPHVSTWASRPSSAFAATVRTANCARWQLLTGSSSACMIWFRTGTTIGSRLTSRSGRTRPTSTARARGLRRRATPRRLGRTVAAARPNHDAEGCDATRRARVTINKQELAREISISERKCKVSR